MNESNSLLGQIFNDRYKIVELVHKGGASSIYRATHELMDRTVALKVMAPHLATDVISIKRFQQEAQAASHLAHPATITIYDFGFTDSQPYLVMDFHPATNMMIEVEKNGPLSVSRFRRLFHILSDAVSHAHKMGVIHRDLKPSHFLLSQYNPDRDNPHPLLKSGEELPVIVDFRMAKLIPSRGKQPDDLNDVGEVVGTPLYMSPEQCMAQEVDGRSDIYSMGCSMYFALTGEPPFQGTSIIDSMQMHMGSKPNEDRLPEEVRNIVLKAMKKRPEDRFQSMDELAESLNENAHKTEIAGNEKGKSWWPF